MHKVKLGKETHADRQCLETCCLDGIQKGFRADRCQTQLTLFGDAAVKRCSRHFYKAFSLTDVLNQALMALARANQTAAALLIPTTTCTWGSNAALRHVETSHIVLGLHCMAPRPSQPYFTHAVPAAAVWSWANRATEKIGHGEGSYTLLKSFVQQL